MPCYYDGLSADESSSENDEGCDSDDDDDDDDNLAFSKTQLIKDKKKNIISNSARTSRFILHLDVDCFYCQCESIDRGFPPHHDLPVAIRQKHLVVTCNYAARRGGVKKLQSYIDAKRICPSIIIYDGSDLEKYRIHAREIFKAFQAACKQIDSNIAVSKGFMDEMMADITPLVTKNDSFNTNLMRQNIDTDLMHSSVATSCYIYGEKNMEKTVLVEDQSGQESIIFQSNLEWKRSAQNSKESVLQQQLDSLIPVAKSIQQSISMQTGFTTSIGLSINPLLAKIASGLHKPASITLLYPWRCHTLLQSMPLRKLPGCGSATMRALEPCLLREFPDRLQSLMAQDQAHNVIWTCRDLMRVPLNKIATALAPVLGDSWSHARKLLELCHGRDSSLVIDEEGLQQTLSVENTFQRETLQTAEAINHEMQDLFRRLPRLLIERKLWSHQSEKAYPCTLRLTVRCLLSHSPLTGRHAVTHSKQTPIDGKRLMNLDVTQQSEMLKTMITPLLKLLLSEFTKLNITRINVALDRFQDVMEVDSRQKQLKNNYLFTGSNKNSSILLSDKSVTIGGNKSNRNSAMPAKSICSSTPVKMQSPYTKRKRIDQFFLPTGKRK